MNILYNYKCVDKSNPTYKSDKSFGTTNEIKLLNYLNTSTQLWILSTLKSSLN